MFSPSAVTITTGGTVNWTWPSGSLPHTVTSGVPGMPDGKFCSLPAGQMPSAQACSGLAYAVTGPATYSHTFTTPGTFPYFCQVHGAMMTGSVTVIAASSTGGTTGATTGATTGGTTGATTGGTTGATTGGTGGTSGATTGGTSGTSGTTGHY
jgi:plastocyanin